MKYLLDSDLEKDACNLNIQEFSMAEDEFAEFEHSGVTKIDVYVLHLENYIPRSLTFRT